MRRIWLAALFVVAPGLFTTTRLPAQQYFGQNQVQYKHFNWRVLETEHFLVHYYPEERAAVVDAARMAERSYARLSRILGHQFREKKPIILFASRAHFGQNNVTGDLGEGTGGVTEAMRHRLIMPLTGDYQSFEHVLAHEMVHEFQYDIFARGKAGEGIDVIERVQPPLWMMEGMAEYLSIGPRHPLTATWLRDAAINGTLPSIKQMTQRPDLYFPYRYGEALWQYIGEKWGDAAIGEVFQAVGTIGIERAFQRELGVSLDDLSREWQEAMRVRYLPQIAGLQRPRTFAQPLLTPKRTEGEIFLAPALSNDGKYIAFLSNGQEKRGEIFIDLWLGDATTGKRIKRLVKSTVDPNFEELRLLYSQSSFSNNGRWIAFTAQREGRDVLYIVDVRNRNTIKRIDVDVDGVTSPVFSPDDKRIAFSGAVGGITDLYIVDIDGKNLQRLTKDKHGDLQPAWSPDGSRIAFASDRGPETNFENLKLGKWTIAVYNLSTGGVEVIPNQAGLNLNPVWSPDGQSLAFISDRTNVPNVFLYDFKTSNHYQLTNVVSGISAITEYSPAITWARGADKLAFTYFENGEYTVWMVNNPRALNTVVFDVRKPIPSIVSAITAGIDTTAPKTRLDSLRARAEQRGERQSIYRANTGARRAAELSAAENRGDTTIVNVAQLLANADAYLPDTTRFKDKPYRGTLSPEYVIQPSVGVSIGNTSGFGQNGLSGGTGVVLTDMLGNHQLAMSVAITGRISDASFGVQYANLSRRLQYATGFSQQVFYQPISSNINTGTGGGGGLNELVDTYYRYVERSIPLIGMYPINRFKRFELGLQFTNIDIGEVTVSTEYAGDINDPFYIGNQSVSKGQNFPSINLFSPTAAYVWDNSLFGLTGPIMGKRYRFQVAPYLGNRRWINYLADYRRYDPIIFNFLTFATRFYGNASVGRDENLFPKYIATPDFVRGYDRLDFTDPFSCSAFVGLVGDDPSLGTGCNALALRGSRVAVANAELRFPIIKRFEIGSIPILPVDGLFFYDMGLAWSKGQKVSLSQPDNYNYLLQRYPLRSYGAGIRVNLFNYLILRWDYAVPIDQPGRNANWTFSLGPSF